MTILKTKADVDSLQQLKQRKTLLKTQIAVEETEIREIWQEVRHDLQPGEIVGQAVRSALGFHNKPGTPADEKAFGLASNLSGPLRLVADTLVRDPRLALLLKVIAPLGVAYLPQLARKAGALAPGKKDVFGILRKSISGLRQRLKKDDKQENN